MTYPESATPDYTLGFSEELYQATQRVTADTDAAYLLPYLRPGLRVLDFGCGAGTISVGLARAVSPGELHGIDIEESQIDLARSVARVGRRGNATFHVGDVTAMPFEDGFFDVAHCRNVLMHVPDTAAVLAEVKRVLKSGGIIGCREMICGSSFTHPEFGVTRRSWDIFEDLIAANDGHPQMGKDMKAHLLSAGFTSIRMGASFSIYDSPEEIATIYQLANNWFLSPEIMESAIKYGASTQELSDNIRLAYKMWREHPGAFFGVAYGEAIASKPHA